MAEKGNIYVLDEPTTGLHLADVEQLLGLLDRLVDSGKSVIVIEHHHAVMATPTGSSTSGPAPATTAAGRVRGHTRGPRRRPLDPHRRAPGGLHRLILNGNEGIGKPEPLKHDFAGCWYRDNRGTSVGLQDRRGEVRIAACRYHCCR